MYSIRFSANTKNKAVIHESDCHHSLKRDEGVSPWKDYESYDEARASAERRRSDVRDCDVCHP